ncbi:hypothetical protein BGX27_000306, partial [Mortierella sp. AM989]
MSCNNLHQACQCLSTQLARYPALAVGLPLVGGFLSAGISRRHIKDHYATLKKPSWAPPSTCFAPIWAVLYLSVGYASHLVALRTGPNTIPSLRCLAKTGLGIYGLNLLLDFAWYPVMSSQKKMGASLVALGGVT